MSYRDDVEAIYQRAAALQVEVDRLTAELQAARRPPPPKLDPITVPAHLRERTAPRAAPPPRPKADLVQVPPHMRERARPVWLPLVPSPRPRVTTRLDGTADDRTAEDGASEVDEPSIDETGLMVARLTVAEHRLVDRLLELLTEDDFTDDAVEHNLRALTRLVRELRQHLAADR